MGTYSKIYSKTTGALWRKGTNRYDSYPAGLIHLWNATSPTSRLVGPLPVYSAASQQPDANGNLVAWPNYIAGKGIVVHPAYTQLAQNSKLLNAVAGSPGTGPDNWTYTVVDSPTMAVNARTVGNSLTFSGTASRGYLSMSQAMAALSVYTFSFNAVCDGVLQIDEIQYCSLTGGTIVVSMDGAVVADENAVPSAGVHAFSIKITAGAVGDTAALRFGLGASAVATGSVMVYEPMLVLSSYLLPYVATGIGATSSIASTAATGGGNGLAFALDSKMSSALSAGGIFTVASVIWIATGSSGFPPEFKTNPLDVNGTGALLYFGDMGGAKYYTITYDGTGACTTVGSWDSGEIHLKIVQTNATGTQFRAGNRRYTGAMVPINESINWSDWAAYDGSFNPSAHLRLGYNAEVSLGFIQNQLWNKSATDAEILALIQKYVELEYLYVYTTDSDGAFILDSDGAEVYEDA